MTRTDIEQALLSAVPLPQAGDAERTGVWDAARGLAAWATSRRAGRPALILTGSVDSARRIAHSIEFFEALVRATIGREAPMQVTPLVLEPASTDEPYPSRAAVVERLGSHLGILVRLRHLALPMLIVPEAVLEDPPPTRETLESVLVRLRKGIEVDREELLRRLDAIGFRAAPTAEVPGEFSSRGGLLDIFPAGDTPPARIEFDGDTVVSIRSYDPESQRSTGSLEDITILPAKQVWLGGSEDSLPRRLLDYFPAGDLVLILDEPDGLERKDLIQEVSGSERFSVRLSLRETPIAPAPGVEPKASDKDAPKASNKMDAQEVRVRRPASAGIVGKGVSLGETAQILDRLRNDHLVFLVARSTAQQQRLHEILTDHGLPSTALDHGGGDVVRAFLKTRRAAPIIAVTGVLPAGFLLPDAGLAFITEEELLGRPRRVISRRAARPFLSRLDDLKPGDLAVHINHGIGNYRGLRRLELGGTVNEFVELEYAGGDRIYIPLDQLDLLQRYVGADEAKRPSVDRLGGLGWARRTQRARHAVARLAEDLVELYAAREIAPGLAFPPDDHLTAEFEATFEYEETPDQLRAIEEVKQDMERPRPMDRLVCGDVGYGKTEVAIRAAFKAVAANKQAAVLVPTTLLAQQHGETFARRFGRFPIGVAVLSRLQTRQKQRAILKDIAQGRVDVLIGTHRLLQKDVVFRDLGLLVIDEEQRFGVRHKERFKKLRREVDVLTLTATPIPRTLQLSLMGVRDLSVIDTPPADRLAIRTTLARFGRELIRSAILQELARQGQVFFIHNRVQTIDRMTAYLRALVPEARIAFAHGQMGERALERVMAAFLRRGYDVLVSTTIVESGLDIPSANTILINRADTFGLSEPYQLRGRVGRSGEQAYAYLLIPEEGRLNPQARERLQALRDFTELGSGFKIAARDLEIRGAGNLFGAEQSGHVAAIGFELYMQMIEKAIRNMRGEPIEEREDPSLTFSVPAYIPEEYIPDEGRRLEIYRRLARVREAAELEEIRAELLDRFGPLPPPLERLVEVIEAKIVAFRLGLRSIETRPEGVVIALRPSGAAVALGPQAFLDLAPRRIRFLDSYRLWIDLPTEPWEKFYAELRSLLSEVERLVSSQRRAIRGRTG